MTAIADADFEAERPRLFGVAYRMTGSASDADDIVQEAWLRAQRADGVANPAAWLTTVVTRLSLDRLRSAARRRERYVGPWLPEPMLTATVAGAGAEADPAERVAHDETLTLSFLHVLDRLEPVERAVFLLREVFAVDYDEVAEVVGRSPSTCRQIARRARERVRADRPRFRTEPDRQAELLDGFLLALLSGEPSALIGLLAEDVVLVSDGGATRRAARNPVVGPHRVSRFLTGLARKYGEGARLEVGEVNASPAVFISDAAEEVALVVAFEFDRELLRRIEIVLAPDKLGPLRAELAGRSR
ncbi:MAG: RNA polymerase sigma factor SigJ [Acidimicrobiales bacterium]